MTEPESGEPEVVLHADDIDVIPCLTLTGTCPADVAE
jgi:hypothetical protein